MDKQQTPDVINPTGKPLQVIPWSEKIANDGKWFERNAEYYIGISRFNRGMYSLGDNSERDIAILYQVYNSKFPEQWFASHTDPLSAKNPAHKQFPAKIRPINILRTNLDLLMAEYPRRPFIYQVNNLSGESYSMYQEQLKATVNGNLTKRFQMALTKDLMEQGLLGEDGQPVSEEAAQQVQEAMDNMELPEQVKESFHGTYKDSLAVKGQKWMKRAMREHRIRQKWNKCFKHWLIAGETYSFKTVEFGNLLYKPISPLMLDFDKSPEEDFVEDGEWCVYIEPLTLSDIVDSYYEHIKKEKVKELETTTYFDSPANFRGYLYDNLGGQSDKIPVYHVVWKGKKTVKILTRINPETFEKEELEVDEDYVHDPLTESVEIIVVNEIYETTKISKDLYIKKQAFPFQRNTMNNFSKTKLPYNGRKFSDLHSENMGLVEMGLPTQIMYIIVTYTLERTLAKSKGKIALIDQNTIPNGEGWDEEKVFYYADTLGYFLVNRNQIGVDKSFNQYQVLDLTLFDSIRQLIELQQHFKQEWDDLLGINRQRKGQTYASDGLGVNERATFQSTVITDMIFNMFEEFTEREMNGLLDLSRFTTLDGVKQLWNDSEFNNELIEIEPEDFSNADLGIFVESSSEAIVLKNKMEANVAAMLQNNVKPSTIFKILQSDNIAELGIKLERIEAIQAEIDQQMASSEAERESMADQRKKDFMQFEALLDKEKMHEEYDRKEEIELIRGEFNTLTFQNGDVNANGTPDILEVEKHKLEREKFANETTQKNLDRLDRIRKESEDRKLKREELKNKIDVVKAKPKPKAPSKKK